MTTPATIQEGATGAPRYVAVRNLSHPQVDSSDPDAGKLANYTYEHCGRWSSVCSAIVGWAIVTLSRIASGCPRRGLWRIVEEIASRSAATPSARPPAGHAVAEGADCRAGGTGGPVSVRPTQAARR